MQFRAVDTHAMVKRFIASGFKEKQAEEVAAAIIESREYDLSNLVTKDFLKSEISRIEAKINGVEAKISGIEAKISGVEDTLKHFATKEELAQVKYEMVKWVVATGCVTIVTVVGTMFGLFKLFIH